MPIRTQREAEAWAKVVKLAQRHEALTWHYRDRPHAKQMAQERADNRRQYLSPLGGQAVRGTK